MRRNSKKPFLTKRIVIRAVVDSQQAAHSSETRAMASGPQHARARVHTAHANTTWSVQ